MRLTFFLKIEFIFLILRHQAGYSMFDFNQHQKLFLSNFSKGKNIILSAPAGTGKSHIIKYIQSCEEFSHKKIVVSASTASAANLINARTIHSFLGIGTGDGDIKKWIRMCNKSCMRGGGNRLHKSVLDCIIIDEFSMLSTEFIELMDKLLRYKNGGFSGPYFGGIQIILIGDVFQLPCINGSPVYNLSNGYNFTFATLMISYRQIDNKFLNILNKIKNEELLEEDIPVRGIQKTCLDLFEDKTVLFSTNAEIDKFNNRMVSHLKSLDKIYNCKRYNTIFFPKCPADLKKKTIPYIDIYEGARYIVTKNISEKVYNGLNVVVIAVSDKHIEVVDLSGNYLMVEYADSYVDELDISTKKYKQIVHYSYIPLRLSYAISIHKSQGMTLENLVIDFSKVFCVEQLYVAVSRLRTLDDLYIISNGGDDSSEQFSLKKIINSCMDRMRKSEYRLEQKKKFMSVCLVNLYLDYISNSENA